MSVVGTISKGQQDTRFRISTVFFNTGVTTTQFLPLVLCSFWWPPLYGSVTRQQASH